jgi:hypothetical protein
MSELETRECEYHGEQTVNEDDECVACVQDRAESLADFQRHGGYHPNTKPLEPHERAWTSREELIRRAGQED